MCRAVFWVGCFSFGGPRLEEVSRLCGFFAAVELQIEDARQRQAGGNGDKNPEPMFEQYFFIEFDGNICT